MELSGCCPPFRRESRSKVSAIMTLIVRYPDGDHMNWFCESESLRVNAVNGGRAWSDAGLARELRFAKLAQTSAGRAEFCRTLRHLSNDATTAK